MNKLKWCRLSFATNPKWWANSSWLSQIYNIQITEHSNRLVKRTAIIWINFNISFEFDRIALNCGVNKTVNFTKTIYGQQKEHITHTHTSWYSGTLVDTHYSLLELGSRVQNLHSMYFVANQLINNATNWGFSTSLYIQSNIVSTSFNATQCSIFWRRYCRRFTQKLTCVYHMSQSLHAFMFAHNKLTGKYRRKIIAFNFNLQFGKCTSYAWAIIHFVIICRAIFKCERESTLCFYCLKSRRKKTRIFFVVSNYQIWFYNFIFFLVWCLGGFYCCHKYIELVEDKSPRWRRGN